MGLLLHIETSTTVCSVCIAKDGEIVAIKETSEEKSHARKLTIFIDQLLKEQNYTFDDLEAVS